MKKATTREKEMQAEQTIKQQLIELWFDLEDAETPKESGRIQGEIDAFIEKHDLDGDEIEEIAGSVLADEF